MPFIDVNIHFVWATKDRKPFLTQDVRNELFEHILYNARKKEIFIESIGGYFDHIHTLVSLSSDLSMSKTVQLIKGESSHWMNREKLIKEKFEWQDEYYALSVSPNQIDRVKQYIEHQEEHHRRKSYLNEVDELLKAPGLRKFRELG